MSPTIDYDMLREARDILGDKFSLVLGYYLEDSPQYIQGIEQGIARGDAAMIASNAHTLKSSSQQYGVMQVYNLARCIEDMAREEHLLEMDNLYLQLHQAYARALPELQALMHKAA